MVICKMYSVQPSSSPLPGWFIVSTQEAALKRSYREVLAQNVPTFFVHLTGSQELIQQRLNERKGHFMPPALLPSQFAILEPLQPDENGVEVSIEGSVEEMVERAVAAVNEYAAKVASQSQQAE